MYVSGVRSGVYLSMRDGRSSLARSHCWMDGWIFTLAAGGAHGPRHDGLGLSAAIMQLLYHLRQASPPAAVAHYAALTGLSLEDEKEPPLRLGQPLEQSTRTQNLV